MLVLLAGTTLTGCGLFDGGPRVEEALEYLPADSFDLQFSDRAAMAERLGLDDLDPRDLSDDDVDDYLETLHDEEDNAVAVTRLDKYVQTMRDAALNALDIEWEAHGSWGDPEDPDGTATVWKVADDFDFDELADELDEVGYRESSSGDLSVYSVDESAADEFGLVEGTYPAFVLPHLLLDEDEQVIATAQQADALDEIADVIADDADSLADDGGMDDLLGAAEDDPEYAWLALGATAGCRLDDRRLDPETRERYDRLGRPDGRALLISGEGAEVLLALQYGSEDEAEDDLEARAELVEEGIDGYTGRPFDDLGDFDLERDGDLVLVEEDFDGGARQAFIAETAGGPGACLAEGSR